MCSGRREWAGDELVGTGSGRECMWVGMYELRNTGIQVCKYTSIQVGM
jgi:hypothetical protein